MGVGDREAVGGKNQRVATPLAKLPLCCDGSVAGAKHKVAWHDRVRRVPSSELIYIIKRHVYLPKRDRP